MRTLPEILSKYNPDAVIGDILKSAYNISVSADKEQRLLQISASFDALIDKELLYRIEAEVAEAYQLNYVKILPKYPSGLFDNSYVSQLLMETERVGIVARGFFRTYRSRLEENVLTVEIPFIREGVMLLTDAHTPEIMSRIIKSEFDLDVRVIINNVEDMQEVINERQARRLEEMDKRIYAASLDYDAAVAQRSTDASFNRSPAPSNDAEPSLPRAYSIFDGIDADEAVEITDGKCTVGFMTFDISEPEYVIGGEFDIKPTPLSHITKPQKNLVVLGQVFGFQKEATRRGDKINVSFCITDKSASIEVRAFGMLPEDADELSSAVKNGDVLALHGYVKKEVFRDRTEGEDLIFYHSGIAKIKALSRKDNAPVKRVELHIHTMMSAMDALIPPSNVVKQANKWGHPAVAITDHGNVQGFQDAMLTAEKLGQKVIWGVEAYFVNNTASALKSDRSHVVL